MRRGHHGRGRAVPAAVDNAAVLVGLADLAVAFAKAAEASADLDEEVYNMRVRSG